MRKIEGTLIKNANTTESKEIVFEDFFMNKGETAIGKYSDVLNKVIELTK